MWGRQHSYLSQWKPSEMSTARVLPQFFEVILWTNGGWANSPESALDCLSELQLARQYPGKQIITFDVPKLGRKHKCLPGFSFLLPNSRGMNPIFFIIMAGSALIDERGTPGIFTDWDGTGFQSNTALFDSADYAGSHRLWMTSSFIADSTRIHAITLRAVMYSTPAWGIRHRPRRFGWIVIPLHVASLMIITQ
jgi:hypothetical protein